MNFINKYDNGSADAQYYYAEEFIENGQPVIFSVGGVSGRALITKADAAGNLLWEKTYYFEQNIVSFRKIIQVSGARYILHVAGGEDKWLMGIAQDGAVEWCRRVFWRKADPIVHMATSANGNELYIAMSDWDSESPGEHAIVCKFNKSGELLHSRVIILGGRKLIINRIRTHPGGIALAGYYMEQNARGVIVDLDNDLYVEEAFYLPDVSLVIHDIEVTGPLSYIVTGYIKGSSSLFIAPVKPGEPVNRLHTFPFTPVGLTLKICTGHDCYYLLMHDAYHGIVCKIGIDMVLQWIKQSERKRDERGNGMNFLNFNRVTGNLTFILSSKSSRPLLAHTDAALTSCRTFTHDIFALRESPYLLRPIEVSTIAQAVETKLYNIPFFESRPVKIEYCPPSNAGTAIETGENTSLQSPNFYLQAAGSTGADGSARGIHLRWIFSGALGQKHLPKGDHAATTANFNKPDDFVRIYRAPYQRVPVTLDFSVIPDVIDDANTVWLYRIAGKVFYVYFRDSSKYNQVRATIDPLSAPLNFMRGYGSGIIEIENKTALFFAVEATIAEFAADSVLRTETCAVAENTLTAAKIVTARKTFTQNSFGGVRLLCENGRSIRFQPTRCLVAKLGIELYSDFMGAVNSNKGWLPINKYALTLDDNDALTRLEPVPGLVNGKWQRYNDNAYVNIDNYVNKWNGFREYWDRNIKMIVRNYITLSDDAANPGAIEQVPLETTGGPGDNTEISNLDLLNIAAYDFHIARMLGLGTLDVSTPAQEGHFIYIAVYITKGDLENGLPPREVRHLSMSLPTNINDQRLPLPVSLKEIIPGAFWGNEGEKVEALTGKDGYTHDGKLRFVTLYHDPLPADQINKPFYFTTDEFSAAHFTFPVYAGLEYRKVTPGTADTGIWEKPELPNDPRYRNIVPAGETPHNETIPLLLPDPPQPLFVHLQNTSGLHYYNSYGINWFSRVTISSRTLSVETNLRPVNPLLPPTNINALLIRQEQPLLLSSQEEQNRLQAIATNFDPTLIRLSFYYHSAQELVSYRVPPNSILTDAQLVNDPDTLFADAGEIMAEEIEIFFRNQVPKQVTGKALVVTDHPTNPVLSIIQTGPYILASTNTAPPPSPGNAQVLTPIIAPGTKANFTGGVFVMGSQQFIVQDIVLPSGTMPGPIFTVFKKEVGDGLVADTAPTAGATNLLAPVLEADGLFTVIENMQNTVSWGSSNPIYLRVQVGNGTGIHRELITITEGAQTERHIEKTRGIWQQAKIETADAQGPLPPGVYVITFNNYTLAQHAQYNANGVSVEWYQGIIRVHTVSQPNGPRKVLQVSGIKNINTANNLVVYAFDPAFSADTDYDAVGTGLNKIVNFYPGYKAYLYTNIPAGLTLPDILPAAGEGVRYSIFGLRSADHAHTGQDGEYCRSKISVPQLMFAQEIAEARPPLQPQGPIYATRPDFFGRATYTLTARYPHKPHGLLVLRSNDEALLDALYERKTVTAIRASLALLGGNDEAFLANRWRNYLDFDTLAAEGDYQAFPANDAAAYKFPYPDKQALFDRANEVLQKLQLPLITDVPGSLAAGDRKILNFVRGAIYSEFVPLTEMPVIYQYINGAGYQPVAKKQVIRNRNGHVLNPADPDFDMAPMMKVTGGVNNETLFTDFTLDGTSNNLYFYGLRELNTQMKMSDFSPFLGPVKLINTNPPEAPEIRRIMPVLENAVLGISPAVQLEVNAYHPVQRVRRLNVYRSFNKLDAQSVRTMKLVKEIDLEAAGILDKAVWIVQDNFTDLPEVPFGEALCYRLTASRKVEYADKDDILVTEYVPSQPSKISATLVVENLSPHSPVMSYVAEPMDAEGVINYLIFKWDKVAYKAKYHVYKMNAQGNWAKIHELTSNEAVIYLRAEHTDLQAALLATKDTDGNNIYHHFKVVAENTAGMMSLEENILTIPNTSHWIDTGGIGDMVIGATFTVR